MKKSRRALRMERQNLRAKRLPGLNLVALMDIFTILVFFLLVNSSDVQEIPASQLVQLPESVSDSKPRQTLMVMITPAEILIDGHPVVAIPAALQADSAVPGLRAAIDHAVAPVTAGEDRGEVTILGDKSIPFSLLRKVMAAFTEAGFGKVSLAVAQKSEQGS